MRTRLILSSIAAATLALLTVPAVVSAAPNDVYISASSAGSTVTVTLHNNSGAQIDCGIFGTRTDWNPEVDPSFVFSKGMGNALEEGGSPDFFPVSTGDTEVRFPRVPDGTYNVDWGCYSSNGGRAWGTPYAFSTSATTGPTPVTVQSPPPLFGSLG
ncbi:hypothetical protein SEA_BLINO_39 [Gordonia phage Blino]|uniref:Uncharacterized protein n=1 Tax=Gordonia phage Blino TaxID=2793696 RepID=A0A7T0Q4D2_9CAUD|nr:hypothetical protein BIZ75_gp38 [Gordonia phage CarolAnn]YP_010114128.1 hypothetical protein KNV70_gp39 [Gordonia phage Blino]AOE44055.1 hypothetical protein SEA_CAROLANN_38 [Gordonia phage CarolAnn]QPL13987.1 hypothetical protein SEA_BLINO_39 [Gordonia phage Blino]